MHELRYYLETLLEHRCSSAKGDCRECRSLTQIYQYMQTEFFSTVIYTETPLDPRPPVQSQSQPFNSAAAGPRRPQAG
jgi:hypothetical protein